MHHGGATSTSTRIATVRHQPRVVLEHACTQGLLVHPPTSWPCRSRCIACPGTCDSWTAPSPRASGSTAPHTPPPLTGRPASTAIYRWAPPPKTSTRPTTQGPRPWSTVTTNHICAYLHVRMAGEEKESERKKRRREGGRGGWDSHAHAPYLPCTSMPGLTHECSLLFRAQS